MGQCLNKEKHVMTELMGIKKFRERYQKYLRKVLRLPETICAMLDAFFCTYKVTESPNATPAQGRLNPWNGQTLFTESTKTAVEECKKKHGLLTGPPPI